MAVLSKQQVIQIIQNAPQGTSPEGVVAALRQQGHQLEGYSDITGTPEAPSPQLKDTGSFMGNVVNSAGNLIGGVASAITHPIKTTEALGKVALGGVEKLIPGRQGAENEFDALTSYYKQRYGSVENFLKTAYQDPVGTAADASLIFGGAAGLLGKAGKLSEIGGLTKTAGVLQKAGGVVNPLNIPGEVVGAVKQIPTIEKAITGIQKLSEVPGLKSLASKLQESTLRLTPTQKVKYAKKLDDVNDYLTKEVPVGNPEARLDFVKQNYDDLENVFQSFISKDEIASARTIDRTKLLDQIEQYKQTFSRDRDAFAIEKQIDSFKKLIEDRYPGKIKLDEINPLKRSTFEGAFNQAGDKVLNSVEYGLGNILKDNIENTAKGLKINGQTIEEFNKHYGTVVTTRKLLTAASGRSQVGALDRVAAEIVGGMVGASTGGIGGGAVGYLAGKAASEMIPLTAIKSAGAKGLSKLSNLKTQTGIKVKKVTSKVPQVLKPTRGKTIMVGRVQRATESNNK